ncbi:MAG TPA: hypothetical protein P5186_02965 [Candidatus Paceibacterota bacterium]|nr:hypothetical protein [Verrucomicrobiota bacterium]HRY46986.1 hypothetical protein [Candidatus Paceibacterota bacterium]HRZ99114.1 hypothetical protein [Candidatus Paceibacterota bacterium]
MNLVPDFTLDPNRNLLGTSRLGLRLSAEDWFMAPCVPSHIASRLSMNSVVKFPEPNRMFSQKLLLEKQGLTEAPGFSFRPNFSACVVPELFGKVS